MKRALFLVALVFATVGGAHLRTVVSVDGQRAVVDDRTVGLEDLSHREVVVGPSEALASCASWDIKENCCPAGCAAKNGTQWTKADQILRGCMKGLGCSDSETNSATVFMKCDCPKK